jgi:hypothetical protein
MLLRHTGAKLGARVFIRSINFWIIVERRGQASKSFAIACATLVQRGLTRIPKNLQLLPLAARTPPCARSLPATHRQPSSPLAAHHSAVSLVPVAPCWAFGLHSPVILLTLLLHFFLNTFFSLTGSIIDKFDIAARSISVFIPSCLDLVVRLSLSYRHRQSRHSLREIQKQQSTHRPLIPLSDRAFHIHTAFPRNVADLFSTYIFISDLPGTKSLP